jgi:hypothetical protein
LIARNKNKANFFQQKTCIMVIQHDLILQVDMIAFLFGQTLFTNTYIRDRLADSVAQQ